MRYLLIIIMLIAGGCASKAVLNDRVTFDAEQRFRQIDMKEKGVISLDNESRGLFVAEYPSGFVGAAAQVRFDLGSLFDSYLKQAMFYSGASGEKAEYKLNIIDFEYTFSGTAAAAAQREFDYCKMDVEFVNSDNPGVRYRFSDFTDIPSGEILSSSGKGRAITETVEKIVQRFLIAVSGAVP